MKKPNIRYAGGILGTPILVVNDERLTKEQIEEMIDALIELVFLNQCELEGLQSGQPTPEQWRAAFDKAEQVLIKAGCSE